jgi:site-specific recombinase XerD
VESRFLELIGFLQKRRRLSDSSLAYLLGISGAHLSYLRHGQRRLKPGLVAKMLDIFPELENFPPGVNFGNPFFASINKGVFMEKKEPSLREFVTDFCLAKQVSGKTKKTCDFYQQNLERFFWWLEHTYVEVPPAKVSASMLRSFLAYVKNTPDRWEIGSVSSRKPASMSTVDAYWRTLHAFFSWLTVENVIKSETNPMRNIPRPKVPEKIIQDIPLLLIKEVAEKCGNSRFRHLRNRAIMLVFLDTGARLSACHGITLANVDIKTGLATVWEKGLQQRKIHLANTAKAALKEYLAVRSQFNCSSLWLKEDGTPFGKTGIQTMIRRLKKFEKNIRWTPHTFRHTFAINLLRGGADTFSLQTLGGWKDLEMPRHYTQALKMGDAIRVHNRTSPADRMMAESE